MKIQSNPSNIDILSRYAAQNHISKKADKVPTGQEQKDKLEISSDAKLKSVSGDNKVHDLSVIRQRIDNYFYNSDEVIEKVADAIMKEFKGLK